MVDPVTCSLDCYITMDVERVTEPAAASSENAEMPDSIRITRHGKLRVWVKKALEFFEVRPVTHETASIQH